MSGCGGTPPESEAWCRGAVERRQNPKPCGTLPMLTVAQDDGRNRTVVSSGKEAARAEHECEAKAAPRTARESWKAARTPGRPGEGCERLLGPGTMHARGNADRGTGLTWRLTGERSESG